MSRGLFTIEAVQNDGGSPTQYTLTVDNSAGVVVDDHIGARLANTAGALYSVWSVPDGTHVVVRDDLTEAESGEFGTPLADVGPSGAWGTPEPLFNLSQLPFDAPGWDALVRRNSAVIDSALAGVEDATFPKLLDLVVGIDLTAEANTVLLNPGTNPAAITKVLLLATQGAGGVPAEVSVGTNSTGWDDHFANTELTNFVLEDDLYSLVVQDKHSLVTTPLVLAVNVGAGGTGGPVECSAYVFGFEV